MSKTHFLVALDLPPRVSAREMAEYIATEVKCGTGRMLPEEPLWGLDRESVKVQPVRVPATPFRTDAAPSESLLAPTASSR